MALTISQLNRAFAAQRRQKADPAAKLKKADRRSMEDFRNFYREVDSFDGGMKDTLRNLLRADDLVQVAHNPMLSEHLKMIRDKGRATDEEIAKIPTLANKLATDADDAINITLGYLRLQDGISDAALSDIDVYVSHERKSREAYQGRQRIKKGLVVGGAILLGVATPLLLWLAPVGGAIAAKFGVAFLQNAQIFGTIAGAAVGVEGGRRAAKGISLDGYGEHE